MNVSITVHRSAHSIGGNCIEVASGSHRIILDCGIPLMGNGGTELPAAVLLDQNLIRPQVTGLFKEDRPEVDAVLFSHAHPDHFGLLSHIHPDIPLYMSEETKTLLTLSDEFWPEEIRPKLDDANVKTYKHGNAFNIGPFTIRPYMMDHSAFGASAYSITIAGQRILYSGDYRAHGRKAKCFDYLLKNEPSEPDCLLVEGTTLGGKHHVGFSSEQEVENAFYDKFISQRDAAFVIASGSNIDRTISLYKATKRAGKILVIDLYQAYVLEQLKQFSPGLPPHKDDHLRVHYIKGHAKVFEKTLGINFLYRMKTRKINREDIIRNRHDMVLRLPTRRLLSLAKSMHMQHELSNAKLVYSMWQGYQAMDDQLTMLSRKYDMPMINVHVSGHAYQNDLQRLVETLKPKKLIPIHTLNRQYFVEKYPQTELVDDGDSWCLPSTNPEQIQNN